MATVNCTRVQDPTNRAFCEFKTKWNDTIPAALAAQASDQYARQAFAARNAIRDALALSFWSSGAKVAARVADPAGLVADLRAAEDTLNTVAYKLDWHAKNAAGKPDPSVPYDGRWEMWDLMGTVLVTLAGVQPRLAGWEDVSSISTQWVTVLTTLGSTTRNLLGWTAATVGQAAGQAVGGAVSGITSQVGGMGTVALIAGAGLLAWALFGRRSTGNA